MANWQAFRKKMFDIAMEGDWDDFVKKYRENAAVRKAKITRSGDTALHMAVSRDQENVVEELVKVICEKKEEEEEETKEILRKKNNRGNTPLHVAASMGRVRMCMCIARVDPLLVGARNNDGETPFFLAALHGNKDAFLCLHNICGPENGESYSRKNNGDTILHCAIRRDNFGEHIYSCIST
ncbi:hypothetical protein L1049_015311 [Liquidambar formosana]|uniref:Uncharacterized protein n=1 Tax=Liquidambar formosana TaxID=63359 RepID=A0AAP0RYN7_LIQFO